MRLDEGPFVAALEFAIGQAAVVLGKPPLGFFASAPASMGCAFEDAVVVDDAAEADFTGAMPAGIGHAILLRTGKYRGGDEQRFVPPPSVTIANLCEAAEWILDNHM